ncbi:MAG TPA: TniQ family protein [Casimicrobiaceae bacterium]|nr:TniQ family protein [Casimicrobiaceae bacterium]
MASSLQRSAGGSPAEIYEVEFFDTEVVEAPRLPARIAPLPDEALASWLLRFADPFGVSPEVLLLGDAESDLAAHPEWWRKPDPLLIAALTRGTGVSGDHIRSLSFVDWPDDGRDDALPDRFCHQRFTIERPSRQTRRIGVCPDCFSEDETPYVRRTWTLGWLAACPIHGVVLARTCPECGTKLRLPALSSRDHFAPGRCPRCAFRLARVPTSLAPEMVLRFQQRLLDGRPAGIVNLPEVGALAWPVAVALFDVLIGAIWIDTKPAARDQLFARITRDLSAEPFGEITDTYQSLAILAWMFDAWPMRAQAALAILRAVRPRRQMQRWPNLDAKIHALVEQLMLGAWPDESPGPERAWWRAWIDTLPETGDDLRAQAARERLPHRRARLLAIADVRDGLPVEVAAEVADVLPRTLYRWIKRGAKGGLRAALERPRWQYLTEPQVMELAEWIAAATPDGPRWRANRVQNEALRRFGVEISVPVAGRLLRKHGPWRRRKVLKKRRLSVAPVYD